MNTFSFFILYLHFILRYQQRDSASNTVT